MISKSVGLRSLTFVCAFTKLTNLLYFAASFRIFQNKPQATLRPTMRTTRGQLSGLPDLSTTSGLPSAHRKVVSSNTSRLEAHAGFFRLLMKGIFEPYVLWPFDKKLIFLLVTHVRTRDYTVFCIHRVTGKENSNLLYGGNIYTSIFSTESPSSHPDSCTPTHSPLTFEFCLLLWSFSHLRQTAYAKAGLQRGFAALCCSGHRLMAHHLISIIGQIAMMMKKCIIVHSMTHRANQPASQPGCCMYAVKVRKT